VVRSDESRRVIVDDILEESDAYRRGLRYGDEVARFGGRSIGSVNALKNALGIYPREWRVPLSFARHGERYDVMVRLRGVHAQAELEEMVQGRSRERRARPMPKPGTPPKEGDPPQQPEPKPDAKPAHPPAAMPDIVKQHFIAKPGYVNYYFNQFEQDRVWKALVARGDYAGTGDVWTLDGDTAMKEPFTLEFTDKESSIKLPSGQLKIGLAAGLSNRAEPPGSGGLLVALALWRRFLMEGPQKFGEVYYLGTAPLVGHEGLVDVLAASYGDVECRFLFDPDKGHLVAMELYPQQDVDPCELYFGEFKEVEGHMLPGRIEARHGDEFNYVFQCKQYGFEKRMKD
ncbi:MAG: PDZ domain-containing protein, partial [Pirellulales bacterium]